MRSRLLLGISVTLLTARLRGSIVAAAGVTFGIAMFITLNGFMNGLNQMLDGLILDRTPHVRLYNEIKASARQPIERAEDTAGAHHFISSVKPREGLERIRNARAIMDVLGQDPRVEGVAPKVTLQAFFNVGTTELTTAVNGFDPMEEERLFKLRNYLVAGEPRDLLADNSVMLGKTLAEKMLADVGDAVQLTTARGERFLLKVVGFYQSGIADWDKVNCYVSVKTAQKLMGEGSGYVTDLQVKLHDLELAPAVAGEYAAAFGCDAIDLKTANAQFETGTKVRTTIAYAVSIALLIVAGFGIYNILNMLIYEKLDSIAILKATGFSAGDVRWIFIGLSLIIGACGGMVGLGLGFALSTAIDHLPFETSALPAIKTFPVDFNAGYYAIGIVFALITTYMAALFPARRAGRVDPVVIIRGK